MSKRILLLGSTGSIGRQVLQLVADDSQFTVVGLSCAAKYRIMARQAQSFNCKSVAYCGVEDVSDYMPEGTCVFKGENALTELVENTDFDVLVTAVVGISGLLPTLAAIKRGKRIALANKETLVTGGEFIMSAAKRYGAEFIPIDSEHSALMQAITVGGSDNVSELVITASGGALRDVPLNLLESSTAEDALRHPNWSMGGKITVDCATMINKAFEVIEAKYLFNLPFDRIKAVLHRESVIHSMATFNDGTTAAIMGYPDMSLPIALALNYPNRPKQCLKPLNFESLGGLSFGKINRERYPLYYLTRELAETHSSYNVLVNTCDEYLTELFLSNKIAFGDIYKTIREEALRFNTVKLTSCEDVAELNREIKERINGK